MTALKKWLAVLVVTLFSLAAAQITVGVDPVTRIHSATPGQSLTQTLTVYNPNKIAAKLRVTAYLTDMNISEVGELSYPPAASMKESLASWVTFSPAEIQLGSEERVQVRYTVQVPANATPGTHWAMLMFEAQDPAPLPGKTLTAFRMRVAHTIYVNVQPTKFAGEIVGIFENPPKQDTDTFDLGIQYANNGNIATAVRGKVEVRDMAGKLVVTLPIDVALVLPGRNLLLKTSWAGPVPRGQYSALVVLQDSDKTRDLVADHVINLPFDLKAKQRAATGASPTATPAAGGAAPASAPVSAPATPASGGQP